MEDVTRLSRRTALAALGGAAAVSLASERARAALAPRGVATRLLAIPGDGPVLGMSREDWVAAMGPGEQVDAGLGDDMYVYGAQNGMLYVTFREFTDGAFANYIEFQIGGDGLPYSQVDPMARSMMPADADATDSYLAPATPGGPTAIATWRYTSEELDAVHPGIPGTFLSLWMQRRGDDNAWLVSSIHLIAGDIMQ
jgi:hypothetical protein